jgi:CBS domain-containing protein
MSARAAWRLDALGFQQLYRYQAGKADWLAAQLALEGAKADTRTAADVARRDVPACTLGARVSEVAEQVRDRGWPLGVVLNERRIVLGRLRPRDLAARPDALAEEIMIEGPRTIRGTRAASEMARWLDERRVPGVLVTTADGELIGYVRRDEL